MKRFLLSIPLIASLFIFTSCGDSHEKLMDDQLSYIEEMTDIIDDVAEGKLSSSQGAEEIKEWGKKGAKLMERKKALNEEMSEEDLKALTKKYEKRSQETMKAYMKAIQKLHKSGRMTKELQEAMFNVKD